MEKLKVTLIKSRYGKLPNQRLTIKALGLNKISSSNIVPDNKAIQGMIQTVSHLVSVERVTV